MLVLSQVGGNKIHVYFQPVRSKVRSMMGHREKLAGDGFDAFARFWRRNLSWRPGQVAKIKRRYAKRARKDGRVAVWKETDA